MDLKVLLEEYKAMLPRTRDGDREQVLAAIAKTEASIAAEDAPKPRRRKATK